MTARSVSSDNSDITVRLLQQIGLEDAARWLSTPHPDLLGLTPEEALSLGRRDDVLRMCAAVNPGSARALDDSQFQGAASMTTRSSLEEIQRIAYELWQIDGEPDGRDKEHWERAARIHASRSSSPEQPAMPGPRNPETVLATGPEDYVTVPSDEDVVAAAVGAAPQAGTDAAAAS